GAEGAGGKEQRVARQERRDDEASFGEHDREQERVDPRAVLANERQQMPVEMQDEVDQRVHTRSSAWLRSSTRSSMSSMPAEILTSPSVMPMAARRSAGTDAWV